MSKKILKYWRIEQLSRAGPENERLPDVDDHLADLWREMPNDDKEIVRATAAYRKLEDRLFELRRVQCTDDPDGGDELLDKMEAIWEELEGAHRLALNEGDSRTWPEGAE